MSGPALLRVVAARRVGAGILCAFLAQDTLEIGAAARLGFRAKQLFKSVDVGLLQFLRCHDALLGPSHVGPDAPTRATLSRRQDRNVRTRRARRIQSTRYTGCAATEAVDPAGCGAILDKDVHAPGELRRHPGR